jgi:hypothetical protein
MMSTPIAKLPPLPPSLSWFSSLVARGQKGIFAEVIKVTPEIAQRFMDANVDNRKVIPRKVDIVKHDILSGHFTLNGETIIISDEGTLNDGQHRLLGIIAAGKAVDCLVCFGPPRASRLTVDSGVVRSAASLLSMQNAPNAAIASVVAKNLFAFRMGITHAQQKIGIPSKQDAITEYHSRRVAIDAAIDRFQREPFIRRTHTITAIAAAYVIVSSTPDVNVEARESFFAKLAEGANLQHGSPILHLRNRLPAQGDYNERRTEARIEFILRYWNAWRGETSNYVSIRVLGKFPDVLT